MNTKKIISVQNEIFFHLKNLWEISEKWTKSNEILDNFLDELNMKKNSKNRFIAYSRISELKVEPLELYLEEMLLEIEKNNKNLWLKLPNKLENKIKILNKAFFYVKNIYEDFYKKFILELEKLQKIEIDKGLKPFINNFELKIFSGVFNVWKAFNNFMPVWQNHITKQNEILDKKFDWNSEKIMWFLREKNLLEVDENFNETDRSYSVLVWWKMLSYFEAFPREINFIISELQKFIENLEKSENIEKSKNIENLKDVEKWENALKNNYINYLTAIKNAFSEKNSKKLLSKWQKVDETWMSLKGELQISHPLEFYEDKYRKWVAPEWDLRIMDSETLSSKVKKNISEMYEKIYSSPLTPLLIGEGKYKNLKEKYIESYNFSKDNFNRVQLYISEPVLYFGSELNWLFSAQVVPNDEIISERFWKKIFAFPKMVLESKKKAPLMKLTKEILDEDLLNNYLKILDNDKLFFQIYDIETIGHEFGHILWLSKDIEIIMNKKTGNFKNIEEYKATIGWLCSYFYWEDLWEDFNKNIIIMHLVRCIWLLKYREVAEVLPYYNESLIHLDIMFDSWIFGIENFKIKLNWSLESYKKLKQNYIKNYKKLINIYLEKIDAKEFLDDYIEFLKDWNNVSKNKKLQVFWNYYYDLYKKIWNEVF